MYFTITVTLPTELYPSSSSSVFSKHVSSSSSLVSPCRVNEDDSQLSSKIRSPRERLHHRSCNHLQREPRNLPVRSCLTRDLPTWIQISRPPLSRTNTAVCHRGPLPPSPPPPKSRILPEITRYQSRLRYKRLEQTMFNPFGRVWSLCIRSYDTSTDSSYLSPETISIFSFCRQFLFFNKHRQRNSNCSEIQTLTIFHRAHFLRRGGEVTEGLSKGKMRRNENHSSKLDLSIAFVREFVLNN